MKLKRTAKFQIVSTDRDAEELKKFLENCGKRKGNETIRAFIREFNRKHAKTVRTIP